MDDRELLAPVADYYSAKLSEHGSHPRGADWNSAESQSMRFEQLCRVITESSGFSINDLGCGYGALLDYLDSRFQHFSYSGIDVSLAMVQAAQARYPSHPQTIFALGNRPAAAADYSVSSGAFNVRLGASDTEWLAHIHQTLDSFQDLSRKGFAFNCLTSYSESEKMKPNLYYANPSDLFDHCKRRYSKQVALLHDYGLYEFTVIVRKNFS